MPKVVREDIDALNAVLTVTIEKEDYEPNFKKELNKLKDNDRATAATSLIDSWQPDARARFQRDGRIEGFLGYAGGTANAIGLQLTAGRFALVVFEDGDYALHAEANVSVAGISDFGLAASARVVVDINTTGMELTRTARAGTAEIPIAFFPGEGNLCGGLVFR